MKNYSDIRQERECGIFEFWYRRIYSSFFYHRIYRKIYPDYPYYTPGAIKFLRKNIHKNVKVFEYGSGQSTIWWSKMCVEVHAIENNENWYQRISAKADKNIAKIHFYNTQNTYDKYIDSVNEFPDKYFDIIIIDGRERVECIKKAVKHVKDGGFLVLDDSHRLKYKEGFELLNKYHKKVFDFGLLQTTIWIIEK